MAYQEKYPLDITPQGDTVRDSIQKNRNELLEVAHQVELKSGGGGGGGGLRNRVLSGKTANGVFTFLSGDGLGVAIDGTSIPVIVSFADGFNEFGAVDYVAQITTKTSAWTLPSNKESYLYIQRSSVGAINYDSTTIKPVRQAQPPAAVLNAFYYNTTLEKMYIYNGTEWQNVQCVFVASVTTDATSVKRIEYYNPESGSVTDDMIGKRTVNDTAVVTGNTNVLTDILNQIVGILKKVSGSEHWNDIPADNIKQIHESIMAINTTISKLGDTYYKKTDTVVEAVHAETATTATTATTADKLKDVNQTLANSSMLAKRGFISYEDPALLDDWPIENSNQVIIRRAAKEHGAPQNGFVLEYSQNDGTYRGRLFVSDNGDDGVYYGGYNAGQWQGWKKIYGENLQDRIKFSNGTELWVT